MRPDSAWARSRQRRLTTTVVAALLVVALALVTPATGPSRGGAHDFVSVHVIFPHHHAAHAAHAAGAGDDRTEDASLTWSTQPVYSSAGPLADAASLASKGLVMAALVLAFPVGLLRLGGGFRVPAPAQRWDAVPTQPPR